MSEISFVFSTIATIMILSFIGYIISRKVLLPNVILLIFTGILCGPVFHLFNVESLYNMVPFLTSLTLIFIGFDSGINMNISEVFSQSGRAIFLSIIGFLVSTITIGFFLHFVFKLGWSYSFLLSTAWGGVSTATVSAVCNHLKMKQKTLICLTMSSLFDDLIVVVTALTILNYISLGGMSLYEISFTLIRSISLSFFIGIIVGIVWLNISYLSRKTKYTFTFTLAALLIVYSITEYLGGIGGIASFIFGLILGNSKAVINLFKLKMDFQQMAEIQSLMTKFHSELTFILSTFFFVVIGLLYVYTGLFELLLGFIISLILHITRLVSVRIAIWKNYDLTSDYPAIGFIVGKGAASVTVSSIPLAYNLPNAELLMSIAINVILLTNIISIILPVLASRYLKK